MRSTHAVVDSGERTGNNDLFLGMEMTGSSELSVVGGI